MVDGSASHGLTGSPDCFGRGRDGVARGPILAIAFDACLDHHTASLPVSRAVSPVHLRLSLACILFSALVFRALSSSAKPTIVWLVFLLAPAHFRISAVGLSFSVSGVAFFFILVFFHSGFVFHRSTRCCRVKLSCIPVGNNLWSHFIKP